MRTEQTFLTNDSSFERVTTAIAYLLTNVRDLINKENLIVIDYNYEGKQLVNILIREVKK